MRVPFTLANASTSAKQTQSKCGQIDSRTPSPPPHTHCPSPPFELRSRRIRHFLLGPVQRMAVVNCPAPAASVGPDPPFLLEHCCNIPTAALCLPYGLCGLFVGPLNFGVCSPPRGGQVGQRGDPQRGRPEGQVAIICVNSGLMPWLATLPAATLRSMSTRCPPRPVCRVRDTLTPRGRVRSECKTRTTDALF